MVFRKANGGKTIPLPTGPSSLQFCLVTIAHGEISPIPNESSVAYHESSIPYGCFMYMFFKLVSLSGCGMGQWCLYRHYILIVATIKMSPRFSEQGEID